MKYQFNSSKHIHSLDDKPLTGTTTVFGVISKPALIPWAVDEALKVVRKKWEAHRFYEREQIDECLEEASGAWTKKRDEAGDIGTQVHEEIEKYIKWTLRPLSSRVREPKLETPQSRLFKAWSDMNVERFLFSELNVYSTESWVGGIVDFGYTGKDSKQYIGDIKTSKSIYPEHFWQMAAYQMQLCENGGYTPDGGSIYEQNGPIDGCTVVNLPKTGGITVETSYGYEDNLQAFYACLSIYRIREKIKQAHGKIKSK